MQHIMAHCEAQRKQHLQSMQWDTWYTDMHAGLHAGSVSFRQLAIQACRICSKGTPTTHAHPHHVISISHSSSPWDIMHGNNELLPVRCLIPCMRLIFPLQLNEAAARLTSCGLKQSRHRFRCPYRYRQYKCMV